MSEKVNHPKHYNYGQIEVIDIIKDAGMLRGFCIGNVLKYALRAEHKGNEIEDLKKARWYLDYWISELEKNNEEQAKIVEQEKEADLKEKEFQELVDEGQLYKREFLKKMGRL